VVLSGHLSSEGTQGPRGSGVGRGAYPCSCRCFFSDTVPKANLAKGQVSLESPGNRSRPLQGLSAQHTKQNPTFLFFKSIILHKTGCQPNLVPSGGRPRGRAMAKGPESTFCLWKALIFLGCIYLYPFFFFFFLSCFFLSVLPTVQV
jgi:hypothetical protein